MRLYFILITFVTIVLFSACTPLQQQQVKLQLPHHYYYLPPQTDMEKNCIKRCAKGKGYCQQICQLKHAECFANATRLAHTQFERYQEERRRDGKKIVKSWRDFDNSDLCYNACNCVPSYNTCYTACGGQVSF